MELTQERFFNVEHSSNSFYAIQNIIENWTASVLLKGELNRVIYASDNYSFRRRYELVDATKEFSTIQPAGLNFPFANYWYSGGWEIDDRPGSIPASLTKDGFQDISTLGEKIRVIPVKGKFTISAYYNRDDDARTAHEILMYEKHPTRRLMNTTVQYHDKIIGIPGNIWVDSINFNPDFNENDWLKNNRIVSLKIDITIRSYIIGYNWQNSTSLEPATKSETFSLTERVILDFTTGKDLTLNTNNELIVEALLEDTGALTVNQFGALTVTDNTATISWDLESNVVDDTITAIVIKIPGRDSIVLENKLLIDSYVVELLETGSTYTCSALIEMSSGIMKILNFTIITSKPAEYIETLKKPASKLIGKSW